jgi:hypothetical protein
MYSKLLIFDYLREVTSPTCPWVLQAVFVKPFNVFSIFIIFLALFKYMRCLHYTPYPADLPVICPIRVHSSILSSPGGWRLARKFYLFLTVIAVEV